MPDDSFSGVAACDPQQKAFLSFVLNANSCASWEKNLRTGELTWSKEHYQIYGLNPSVAPSLKNWLKTVYAEDREELAMKLSGLLHGNASGEPEFRLHHPLKGIRWLSLKAHVFLEDGKPVRVAGISRDITLRKACEQILEQETGQKTAAEIDQTPRHGEDTRQLADAVANELRNPLAGLRLALYNLKKKVYTPFTFEQFEHIERKLAESARIIENLLSYSHLRSPVPGKVGICSLLDTCIDDLFKRSSGSSFEVDRDYAECRETFVKGDGELLALAFNHLLDNAVQSFRRRKGRIWISCRLSDTRVHVRVRDNGCGIRKSDLPHIFTPLFTTKPKGAGLGLPICKQVVTLHDGTIIPESSPGKGTAMLLTLPQCI